MINHSPSQLGNVAVMKLLVSLGADTDLHPDYRPSKPPNLARQRAILQSARTPLKYIPTETEYNITLWSTDYYGIEGSPSLVFDPTPLKITSPPDMESALRELGVVIPKAHTGWCLRHRGTACGCRVTGPAGSTVLPPFLEPRLGVRPTPPEQPLSVARSRRGVRVLCLDGGGVRGLVELEILRQIEQILKLEGKYKRITDMFDYIVGTSTGGVIALSLVYGTVYTLYIHASFIPSFSHVQNNTALTQHG